MATERRLAFGEVARLYEQARPSYPVALVDDVLAFAGAGRGDGAVEVGAGTGKATAQFAQRGLHIRALEPDPEMAAVASERLALFPDVTIEQLDFEHWRPSSRCKLVYSAQAWHWVDPKVRFVRARRALADGGALAAFWNRPVWDEASVREEFDRAYAEQAPDLGPHPGPMHPGTRSGDWMTDVDAKLGRAAGFSEFEAREYPFRVLYTSAEYVDLLRTHSDHILLPPERRDALLDAIAAVIDSHGGSFELPYVCRLALGRAVAPTGVQADKPK